MSTTTELLKEVLVKAGGDVETLKDNLESTILKAIADAIGNSSGGSGREKILVFRHECNGNINSQGITIGPIKDLIQNYKDFVIEIEYEYYDMFYHASISNNSCTVKKGNTEMGISGKTRDEWGENVFDCLTSDFATDTYNVTVKSSGGTLKGFYIYEIA